MHGRQLIGGYLSRVSRRRIETIRADEMLDALIVLSEGGSLDATQRRRLVAGGDAFARRARLGYVVVDGARTPAALRDFVIEAFALQPVESDDQFELYRPAADLPGQLPAP
jgi:hypothetical protein